jgi:23S rRNA (uracil1939-C5)-methyltransferase
VKPPALRPGEVLDLEIEKGVYRGLGLARHHGQVVFVPHVLPGERVRARVQQVGRGFVQAHLEAVLTPAADRRDSPCPYVPRCGGCAHQEMEYAAQLRLKVAVLRDALGRAGVPWEAEIPVRGSAERGWRTRAVFHVASGAGGLQLGLYEEGTHRVVDLEACLQVSDAMNRTARAILAGLRERADLALRVKGIALAESGDGQQLVAVLQVEGELGPLAGLAALQGDLPWVTGLALLSERGAHSTFVMLHGEPYVVASVGGLTLRSHACAFFQGNRFLVEPLAEAVLAELPVAGTVLDLYSGVGLFSLLAARRGATVHAAELDDLAVADARHNAERAGLKVAFEIADVRTALASWPVTTSESVILDPPRSGAEPGIVEAIAARKPERIVYVSCDPPTLGRDLKRLAAAGYRLQSLQAFDLFPDTFHVETIASLVR